LEPLVSVAELAEYLGLPVATIYDWRAHGRGPVGYRFGKHVKFAVSDVATWVEAQRDRPAGLSAPRKGGE
jgi:excisionase family DNA binding protein